MAYSNTAQVSFLGQTYMEYLPNLQISYNYDCRYINIFFLSTLIEIIASLWIIIITDREDVHIVHIEILLEDNGLNSHTELFALHNLGSTMGHGSKPFPTRLGLLVRV